MDRTFAPVLSSEQKPYEYTAWPAWRYSPEGQSAIFDRLEDVPAGWGTLDDFNGAPPSVAAADPDAIDAELAQTTGSKVPTGMERPRELTDEQRADLHARLMQLTQSSLAAALFEMSGEEEKIEFLPSWPKAKLADTIIDNGGPPAGVLDEEQE